MCDTTGPGRRADDIGCLLAHLAVFTDIDPINGAAMHRLGARQLYAFDQSADRVELRYRVGGVLMSLATGPHRVQPKDWQSATTRRVDLVERWVDSASKLGARTG